jgi:hypothetical protein
MPARHNCILETSVSNSGRRLAVLNVVAVLLSPPDEL